MQSNAAIRVLPFGGYANHASAGRDSMHDLAEAKSDRTLAFRLSIGLRIERRLATGIEPAEIA